ncbi:hypothetical protein BJ684DRAFT_10445 [Piptocephalis cylindrospora]|uniref:Uncharacterized protein n=1 Tax=Piptocephalis cylindrospora TaxID=1907219 RepID=A0A4V1IY34_9FUNG|nr:hypothetical protein BJ684DRAFT_10445 [Piptocephalis cylindrospora]|eukprot:RKP13169.1 hypothetical protein BJ684DRAFT_10445 [Piptocephalis cylindrospora]
MALWNSLLQAVVIIALEIAVFVCQLSTNAAVSEAFPDEVQTIQRAQALSVYHILFIVAQLFQLILFVDAVRQKNTIQIIGLILYNFVCMAYSILQIVQGNKVFVSMDVPPGTSKEIQDRLASKAGVVVAIVLAVVMGLFSMSYAIQAWALYKEFGWSVYKKIGADIKMRRKFMIYQVYVMLLKLDVFMLLAFSCQYLVLLVNESNTLEGAAKYQDIIVHCVVSVGGCCVMLVLGFWSVRAENKWGMGAFGAGIIATIGYMINRLVLMQPPYSHPGEPCILQRDGTLQPAELCDRYDGSRNFFTLFLIVDILLALVTLIVSLFVYRNFGQGLRQHFQQSGPNTDGIYMGNYQQQKRWSIE